MYNFKLNSRFEGIKPFEAKFHSISPTRHGGKLHILILNHYAGTPELGMEFRPYYLAREWKKRGYLVTIIAGDYSHLRMNNPRVEKDFQKEIIDGIRYCWVKTGNYSGNGVRRALTMFRFVGKLWWNAQRIVKSMKPDVIITSSTYPLDTFAGQKMARLCDAKLIHEVHDMWPATLIELGGMKRTNPFVMLIQAGENSAYRNSDYVVSLPPCAKEYMVQHGMQEDKFVNIQNGIVLEEWEKREPIPEEHRKILVSLKEEGKFIVGYFGGHALSNALDGLLNVAKEIKKRDIAFVLVGDGVQKPGLIQRAQKEQIENVYFLDPVRKLCVGDLLRYFDCSYIGSKESPLYRFGLTANKMYDSMMAGKPLICAVNAAGCVVETYRCGIMIKTGKTEDICRAIEQLHDMSEEERHEIGNRGVEAARKYFTYEALANQFEKLF